MNDHIAIIANGCLRDKKYHKQQLRKSDLIICADGGANHAKDLEIIPDYIIGDLDSITRQTVLFFKEEGKTEIIQNPDQNKTDLELALSLAETFHPNSITIFGAIGNRMDHTLANIYCLKNVDPNIKTTIIDDVNTIDLIQQNQKFYGKKDEIISIIPLTDISDLSYKGLQWDINHKQKKVGWFGISNRFKNEIAEISFSKGVLFVIRVRNSNA